MIENESWLRRLTSKQVEHPSVSNPYYRASDDCHKVRRFRYLVPKTFRTQNDSSQELLRMRLASERWPAQSLFHSLLTWCIPKKLAAANGIPEYTGKKAKLANVKPKKNVGAIRTAMFDVRCLESNTRYQPTAPYFPEKGKRSSQFSPYSTFSESCNPSR